jgi:hypothetical protein
MIGALTSERHSVTDQRNHEIPQGRKKLRPFFVHRILLALVFGMEFSQIVIT